MCGRARGSGDSDWKRSSRQQEVLIALRHKMAQPSQILKVPSLVSILGATLATNIPAAYVADFVAEGQNVPSANITQVVLGPPHTVTGVGTQRGQLPRQ